VLWSGTPCRDPSFKSFDYNNNFMKVRIHFTKNIPHAAILFSKFPGTGLKTMDIGTHPELTSL